MRVLCGLTLLLLAACLGGCGEVWNDPYPAADRGKNYIYESFNLRPKHLDPTQSYSEDETHFIAQIYEPPLQYHYLKLPYTLVPLTVGTMPVPRDLDAQGNPVGPGEPAQKSVYEIRIKSGIRYQPHPAFARTPGGELRYHDLSADALRGVYALKDFKETGTRELTADDYVYQIKRLAHPRLHSPVFGLISEHIVGLKDLAERLRAADKELANSGRAADWLDLSKFPLAGAEVVDRYTYRITLQGRYPQFQYWLAMSFFAPMPIEADRFFAQPGMAEKNLTLDWYPVGTGPYMLTENDPNARMVLERNPNYHGERYPDEGEPQDRSNGLLADAGKPLPFVDKVIFTREKEGIPLWNKFLQGYYDFSSISSDSFDQAVRLSGIGEATLSADMEQRGIRLQTSVAPSSSYFAFNWLDPLVGAAGGERAKKLRQAISIAIDWEEFISIFRNGRATAAFGPIPPGIFGIRDGEAGINPVVYDWVAGAPRRKSIEQARRLLAEAGYPDGRDAQTGAPLVLYFDTADNDKARGDWYRKQLAKLDIQLELRITDYNRFQEKTLKGTSQMFAWGWNADYPDPENFLFLFHTLQGKVKYQGENAANYSNPQFDEMFEKMKNLPSSPERQELIDRMVKMLREDAPWSFGYYPKVYTLHHGWMANLKPNQMARNDMKYKKVDAGLRETRRHEWNGPVVWPLALGVIALMLVIAPAVRGYRRRERETASAS
jgi:oligopeptide transport system substrate-binding protein